MRRKLSATKHSMKMQWVCAALVLLAVVVAFATNASVLLYMIPGTMVWMMMGGMGGGTRGGEQR